MRWWLRLAIARLRHAEEIRADDTALRMEDQFDQTRRER